MEETPPIVEVNLSNVADRLKVAQFYLQIGQSLLLPETISSTSEPALDFVRAQIKAFAEAQVAHLMGVVPQKTQFVETLKSDNPFTETEIEVLKGLVEEVLSAPIEQAPRPAPPRLLTAQEWAVQQGQQVPQNQYVVPQDFDYQPPRLGRVVRGPNTRPTPTKEDLESMTQMKAQSTARLSLANFKTMSPGANSGYTG